jgi:hypothetical protein
MWGIDVDGLDLYPYFRLESEIMQALSCFSSGIRAVRGGFREEYPVHVGF